MIYVIFMVNATGVRVKKEFDTPYEAERFWNKLRYSKKLTRIMKMTDHI